jgi:hypothetical protein
MGRSTVIPTQLVLSCIPKHTTVSTWIFREILAKKMRCYRTTKIGHLFSLRPEIPYDLDTSSVSTAGEVKKVMVKQRAGQRS